MPSSSVNTFKSASVALRQVWVGLQWWIFSSQAVASGMMLQLRDNGL